MEADPAWAKWRLIRPGPNGGCLEDFKLFCIDIHFWQVGRDQLPNAFPLLLGMIHNLPLGICLAMLATCCLLAISSMIWPGPNGPNGG